MGDQRARLVGACRFAQQEDNFDAAAGRQFDLRAHRRTRIETGTDLFRQRRSAGQRGGIGKRAVAADELAPIARPIALRPAPIDEGDTRSEAHAPRIAGEDRPGGGVEFGGDERQRSRSRRAKNPLDISGHAEPTRAARLIGQNEPRNLDQIAERHVLHKIGGDLVPDVLESAVTAAVAGRVGRRRVADGRRGRAPQVTRFVVAQIEGFAASVADGIVRPRGELVLAAVDGPGVAAALGSRLEPESRIGDDVDPRRRR